MSSTLYKCTGSVQEVTLQPGLYQLECWGGNGGSASYNGYQAGGIGGYSRGNIDVKTTTVYYLRVGGKGDDAQATNIIANGGYNGGGTACTASTSNTSGAGGGGSDIRTAENIVSSRIIVAGGGGGARSYNSVQYAFNGGGTTSQGRTASQTTGFTLLNGQNASKVTNVQTGAGGGYWGGKVGTINNISNVGDGGSGYVGGVINGVTVQPTESQYISNPITDGNGCIRITILELYNDKKLEIVYDDNTMGCDSTFSNVEQDSGSRVGNNCISLKNNQYVALPTTTKLTHEFTINIWAYKDNWAGMNNNQRIISCTESGGWNIEGNNTIGFALYDGDSSSYKSFETGKPWSSLSSGWHMFTLTFDGTKGRGYIDGAMLGESETFLNAPNGVVGYNSLNTIFIGAEAETSSSTPLGLYFDGQIDDLKIYASCLSDEDIKKEYTVRTYLDDLGNLHTASAFDLEKANMLTNPSFETNFQIDGNAPITRSTEKSHSGNYSLKFIKESDSTESYCYLEQAVITSGHKYYFSIWYNAEISGGSPSLDLYWKAAEPNVLNAVPLIADGQWHKVSGISKSDWVATDWSGSHDVRVDFNLASGYTGTCYYDDACLVDLTKLYGEGNEPTLEQINKVSIDEKGVCHTTISEGGRALRYIRLYTNGSNENSTNHITTLDIINSKGKKTNLLDAVNNTQNCTLSTTLGRRSDGAASNRYYFEYNANPLVIDINKIDIIKEIKLVRYYADNRYYYCTKIEGSIDKINWFTIYDSYNLSGGSRSSNYMNYTYTGDVQTITLQPGSYNIECWGATGGQGYIRNEAYSGGLGGYSKGLLNLSTATTLYLCVGGKGSGISSSSPGTNITVASGYNGGGQGCSAGAGGGATHIALSNGILSSLENNKSSILFVAGGGGGSSLCPSTTLWDAGITGGAGGGTTGTAGISSSDNTRTGGGPGTQTAGGPAGEYNGNSTGAEAGSFGKGGNVRYDRSWTNTYRGGAGGGGYYGGGAATQGGAGGGGGSGYIATSISNGHTYNSTQSGFVINPDSNGNGYIRITSVNDSTYNTYIETVVGKTFKVECDKAQIISDDNLIVVNEFNRI